MSVIDAVVSAAAILFAMAAAVFPRRVAYALPVALPLLLFGCLVQFVLEDFYWQMVPCYLAIVAATLLVFSRLHRAEPAVTERTRKRRVLTVLAPVAVGLLAVLAILPWSIPPVPTLPEPTGRYRIGSEIFRRIDEQRPETSTDSTADRRNVIVQAWYPTDDRPDAIGALSGRLDTDHIAAIGHSFGGASVVAAAADEPRIKAVANIDGTLYGDPPALKQPFLLVESDHSDNGHSAQYLDRDRDLIQHLQATGSRYEIAEANHFGFTDIPLFLTAPARFAVAQFIGGERGPVDTPRAANDILVAFLRGGDIQAAAAGHPNIHGGPVP